MKAATYEDFSTDLKEFSAISVNEIAVPSLGENDVLVRVFRAAANPIDSKVMAGYMKANWPQTNPFTMGYDFSGEVAAMGKSVEGFSIGEEVFAVNWGKGNHFAGEGHVPGGTFAEFIKIPVHMLSRKPEAVSHDVAAALALVGSTAYEGLAALQVGHGTKLLILGGATTVGFLATQLAKLKGADVTITCSHRAMKFVEKAKPDHIIDYQKTKWWETGTVYDAIFDAVGETDGFLHAKKCIKPDGAFISIANLDAGFDPTAHLPLRAHFFGLSNSTIVQDDLMGLVQTKQLIVPIEAKFPFTTEGVRAMMRKQEEGKSMGKNILLVSS